MFNKKKIKKDKKEIKTKSKKKAEAWIEPEGELQVDVYQTKAQFIVVAPIAGVDPEEVNIFVENEMLVIKGERKEPEIVKEKNYFYQECYWGPFSRKISLPEDVDASRIKASMEKGILIIKIPRVVKTKKKKITITN